MSTRTKSDGRQSQRYSPKTDVFVVFRPDYSRIGKLKDVSSGGVAFEYALFERYEELVDAEVDIFTSEPDLLMLGRVPCRVVYDMEIEKPTFVGIETRRCGLKLEHLSPRQRQVLNLLLISCVSHPLPSK